MFLGRIMAQSYVFLSKYAREKGGKKELFAYVGFFLYLCCRVR